MKKVLLFSFLFFCACTLRAQIITTVAGTGTLGYNGDNILATDAELYAPIGIAVDNVGNVYIADTHNNRIRKVDSVGIITTIAGSGINGYNGDNIPANTAELRNPVGIICDNSGNVYFADSYNNRIRKINTDGIITTIAGNDTGAYNGDNILATAAEIYDPHCLALDGASNLYFTDWGNHRIRKVTSAGIITTIAGTGVAGYTGDNGPADTAEINTPYGIAIDNASNIYFVDAYENVIRKIDASGIITTIAGGGIGVPIGDNGPATGARLNGPGGIAIDNEHNIYVADAGNQRIRKIAAITNIITTIAGNGTTGYSGDNGPATNAELNGPVGIATDADGALYISDFNNSRIRRIGWPENVVRSTTQLQKISIYPNPAATHLIINAANKITSIVIRDLLGREVYSNSSNAERAEINIVDLPSGIYVVNINGIESRKFVKL